jgi:hypothetical protein
LGASPVTLFSWLLKREPWAVTVSLSELPGLDVVDCPLTEFVNNVSAVKANVALSLMDVRCTDMLSLRREVIHGDAG